MAQWATKIIRGTQGTAVGRKMQNKNHGILFGPEFGSFVLLESEAYLNDFKKLENDWNNFQNLDDINQEVPGKIVENF